jgi:Cu+-exporting ATPase
MSTDYQSLKLSKCYHCGEDCKDESLIVNEKPFCCEGCKLVYELLNENGLCNYYTIENTPGTTQNKKDELRFGWLDDHAIINALASFREDTQVHINLFVPAMHCSSCIWLLENLQKLNPGILNSRVDFPKKKVFVVFDESKVKLSEIATLLTAIGYEPTFSLSDTEKAKPRSLQRYYWYKIGVAGFCFGNVMMLSFPEYFASNETSITPGMKQLFGYLNIGLSLPVLLYSSVDFFRSAWGALKQKYINIDAPIALALMVTFLRSVYDIAFDAGPGYMDTFTGLVFFMLIGRLFQNKTYDSLSFERDYKSYFPVAVTRMNENGEKSVHVNELKQGDHIRLRNKEILPSDSFLQSDHAKIDYSFVTGETIAVSKKKGDLIYAGAIIEGASIDLIVKKTVSQSYLTQLWNNTNEEKEHAQQKNALVTKINLYFSSVVMLIALTAGIYWGFNDSSRVMNAVTTILIIACPCALLLSSTFTNGNMLRLLGRKGFYLKNGYIIESLRNADVVVFDKTGTITRTDQSDIRFVGEKLSPEILHLIASAVSQSNHPLSRMLAEKLSFDLNENYANQKQSNKHQLIKPDYFEEKPGKGLIAYFDTHEITIGSAAFTGGKELNSEINLTKVFIASNGKILGYYEFKNAYREGIQTMILKLRKMGKELFLLSGDNDSEAPTLSKWFGGSENMRFNCKPDEKKTFIAALQADGKKVVMMGDGLNDAGALSQSDAGIAVSDNINNFSPACDAIIKGETLSIFDRIMDYSTDSKKVLFTSFGLSLIYNAIGLYFAVQGLLAPVIAALIMPISSVTIVLLTTGLSSFLFRKVK